MEYHIAVIASLARRPGMYAGSTKLQDVATFFNGYIYALSQCGVLPIDNAWGTWIGQRFEIWHTAWSWDRTLLHSTGSEEEAIASLPELFRLYIADVREIGVEGIERRHRAHFHKTGEPICYAQRVPDKTFTSDPF